MRTLIAAGYFGWNAVERRMDRYGSVRLFENNSEDHKDVFVNQEIQNKIEGKKGKLIAEVIEPVKSQHMGDLARGLHGKTPNQGQIFILGEGELFFEHFDSNEIHEKSSTENFDDQMMNAIMNAFKNYGVKVESNKNNSTKVVYDLIGLKPEDGRTTDWLDPQTFYDLHQSKINLYFEET